MLNTMTRTYVAEGDNINRVDVEIRYEKGGFNYFFGKNEQRGYYLGISDYKLVDHGGYMSREFVVGAHGHGVKACVIPCGRQSKKRFEEACAMMDDLIERFLPAWLEENGVTISDEYTVSVRDRAA